MTRLAHILIAVGVVIVTESCAKRVERLLPGQEPSPVVAELWAGFESQDFIRRVEEERIEFDYTGIYRDVLNTVTPADVRWACDRLASLSDRQWSDAFRAAGYAPEQTARYVTKIRSKIDQGLALTAG